MEKTIYYKNYIRLYCGLASVIISSFIVNFMILSGFTFDNIIINREIFLLVFERPYKLICFIVIYKRIKQLLLIYVLYKLVNAELAYNILISILSFAVGIFISVQSYYEGFAGVVEYILYLFPHYIFYMLIIGTLYRYKKRCISSKIYTFLLIVLFFLSGILCELFFSKFFLYQIYQYMVLD